MPCPAFRPNETAQPAPWSKTIWQAGSLRPPPPDPDRSDMGRKFAEAAAEEFNRQHEAHVINRKKMGR